jgi:hypothetical protein
MRGATRSNEADIEISLYEWATPPAARQGVIGSEARGHEDDFADRANAPFRGGAVCSNAECSDDDRAVCTAAVH